MPGPAERMRGGKVVVEFPLFPGRIRHCFGMVLQRERQIRGGRNLSWWVEEEGVCGWFCGKGILHS